MTPQELRVSILQHAIQGKLVEQRTEEGTGEELFKQIQSEKQALNKVGKIKKEKPLPEITDEEKSVKTLVPCRESDFIAPMRRINEFHVHARKDPCHIRLDEVIISESEIYCMISCGFLCKIHKCRWFQTPCSICAITRNHEILYVLQHIDLLIISNSSGE